MIDLAEGRFVLAEDPRMDQLAHRVLSPLPFLRLLCVNVRCLMSLEVDLISVLFELEVVALECSHLSLFESINCFLYLLLPKLLLVFDCLLNARLDL